MASIGEKIKMARDARGWSQDQLAEAVGVEPATVSRWENDKARPVGKLPKIAKALNRSVEWFQGQSEPSELAAMRRRLEALEAQRSPQSFEQFPKNERLSAQEADLIRLFREADPKLKIAIFNYVKDPLLTREHAGLVAAFDSASPVDQAIVKALLLDEPDTLRQFSRVELAASLDKILPLSKRK